MTIVIEQLTKKFGEVVALRDISLTLPSKTMYTIVGATNSGKSTLLAVAAGILKPTSGSVDRNGDVGYIPENPLANELMTARQYIKLTADLKNISLDVSGAYLSEFEKKWSLSESLDTALNRSTKRVRFLTSLIAATVYNPQLLIVDEPPLDFLPFVLEVKNDSMAQLFATRHVSIARKLNTDAALIEHGTIQGHFTANTIDELSRAYNVNS